MFRLSKTFLYEKQIHRATDSQKSSILHSRKPFLIRFSRFFIFDTSIENLMPKRELQPLRIGYAQCRPMTRIWKCSSTRSRKQDVSAFSPTNSAARRSNVRD